MLPLSATQLTHVVAGVVTAAVRNTPEDLSRTDGEAAKQRQREGRRVLCAARERAKWAPRLIAKQAHTHRGKGVSQLFLHHLNRDEQGSNNAFGSRLKAGPCMRTRRGLHQLVQSVLWPQARHALRVTTVKPHAKGVACTRFNATCPTACWCGKSSEWDLEPINCSGSSACLY